MLEVPEIGTWSDPAEHRKAPIRVPWIDTTNRSTISFFGDSWCAVEKGRKQRLHTTLPMFCYNWTIEKREEMAL